MRMTKDIICEILAKDYRHPTLSKTKVEEKILKRKLLYNREILERIEQISGKISLQSWFGRNYDFLAIALFKRIQIYVISEETRTVAWYLPNEKIQNIEIEKIW